MDDQELSSGLDGNFVNLSSGQSATVLQLNFSALYIEITLM